MLVRAMVWNPALLFLVVIAVAPLWCFVACDIHAERPLAKEGGSNCKLRGLPTLAMERSGMERAQRERRSAQAQRGRLGTRLAGARGGAPLRGLAVGFIMSFRTVAV